MNIIIVIYDASDQFSVGILLKVRVTKKDAQRGRIEQNPLHDFNNKVIRSSTSPSTKTSGLQLLLQQRRRVFNFSFNKDVGSSTSPITRSLGLQLL